jgi:aerobic carbon-monoxide dehydrogenase medium subunit
MSSTYHQPTRLEEALRLVAKGAQPVAGATALFTGKGRPEGDLVDITRLGMGTLAVEKTRISLGATCTLAQIGDAELPGMEGALLRRAVRAVGSRPLRNVITVGGNIAHLAFWADLPVALLALDAQAEVQKAGEAARLVDFAECMKQKPWDGGLITRVVVPLRAGTLGFGHERFSRTANDYAFATVCATLKRDGGVAREVRVVVGALQPRAFRVAEVEAMVEGKGFDLSLLEEAGRKLSLAVSVAPNFRASAEYRRELAGVLSKRALQSAFTWAMREA